MRFAQSSVVISLDPKQVAEILAHAIEAAPQECCGLIGGTKFGVAQSIYRTRNIAANRLVSYEAAPDELFDVQRKMRDRREELIGIYHSHPRATDPQPSETDVRLAYYPSAVYFIVGLGSSEPRVRAFRISQRDGRWETVDYVIAEAESN